MKHYDISILAGPHVRRVEATDFDAAARELGLDPAAFRETSSGVYEGGGWVVQEIDAEPFHVAASDLEELVAALETQAEGESLADRNPALARIARHAKAAARRARSRR